MIANVNWEDPAVFEFHSDIERLPIPQGIRDDPDPQKKRERLIDWIEERVQDGGTISATSVAVESSDIKTLLLEIEARSQIVEGRVQIAARPLAVSLRTKLATVSGRPLAVRKGIGDPHLRGVKIGQRELDAKQLRELERRGGDANIYRDYPAVIEGLGLVEAHQLLMRYGWRLSHDRANWLLYEVGGPLEEELAVALDEHGEDKEIHELRVRAREICESALPKLDPEPKSKPEPEPKAEADVEPEEKGEPEPKAEPERRTFSPRRKRSSS